MNATMHCIDRTCYVRGSVFPKDSSTDLFASLTVSGDGSWSFHTNTPEHLDKIATQAAQLAFDLRKQIAADEAGQAAAASMDRAHKTTLELVS